MPPRPHVATFEPYDDPWNPHQPTNQLHPYTALAQMSDHLPFMTIDMSIVNKAARTVATHGETNGDAATSLAFIGAVSDFNNSTAKMLSEANKRNHENFARAKAEEQAQEQKAKEEKARQEEIVYERTIQE